MNSILRRNSK